MMNGEAIEEVGEAKAKRARRCMKDIVMVAVAVLIMMRRVAAAQIVLNISPLFIAHER